MAIWTAELITTEVRALYLSRWGNPSRTAQFAVAGLTIEVLKWSAAAVAEGVNIYATNGASAWPANGQHRAEFFLGLLPAEDGVASPLAALGMYSAREGVVLDHGHTVPADEPLWSGTKMRHFLIMRPLVAFMPPISMSDGQPLEFFQAIPIYQSELAFKAAYGAEELITRWEEAGVQFWDPYRKPSP